MQELFRFMESHHSELQHISLEEGHRRGHVGFSDVHSTFELYFTDVKLYIMSKIISKEQFSEKVFKFVV